MTEVREIYLGAGVHVSFNGWTIRLRSPREDGDCEVFLEPAMMRDLMRLTVEWYEGETAARQAERKADGRKEDPRPPVRG